jgi:hypothetical protein
MTFGRTAALVAALAAVAVAEPSAAAGRYYNVSNAPFATISNGPQNAIIVDVANPKNPAEVKAAVNAAVGPATRGAGNPLSRQIGRLRKAGLIRRDVHSFFDALVLVRSAGTFEPPTRATRAYGGGTITFQYSGWGPAVESQLRAFELIAYPVVRAVYGDPASTITVTVVGDSAQTVRDQFLGGVYVTGSGVQREIRLYPAPSGGILDLERMFLFSMIRAFHDTTAFYYDAWEEGFKRAAAIAAGEQIDRIIAQNPGSGLVQMDFVGRSGPPDPFSYLMADYELLNQPPLSNSRFVTSWTDIINSRTDVFGGMFIPRLGMSSTAWLKAYIERLRTDGQSFFRLFNQAYYQQLSGNPGLAGNVPALKAIGAGIAPSVENLPFEDWFRRQFIFDTSISIGKKLYAFATPVTPTNPAVDGYSVVTFLLYYATASTGDETPLSGTVYPVYWDYLYATDLFLSPQYEIVPIGDQAPGEGYVEPTFFVDNIGGPQRVAMDFTLGTESARVYFPAGMTGTEASPNNFLGAVIGADSGTVNARVDAEPTGTTTPVTNGAFGTALASLLGFSRLTITYTPQTGSPIAKVANAGPGSYLALVQAPAAAKSLTHTFLGGTRMISVPMTTFAQDQAQALQGGDGSPAIPADKLLLARWNPLLTDAYKYEMYPRTPPFTPGRGYWVKFPATTIVTVVGQTPDPVGAWRIGLAYGWNQIGAPFETSASVSSLMVEKANDEPLVFQQAWSTGLVGKIIWKYTPGTGYTEAATLDRWEGYWVKCNVPDGAVLIVPGTGSRGRSRSVAASAGGSSRVASGSKDEWEMKLSARSSDGTQSGVRLGVAAGATDGFDNAFDAELPPAYGQSVTLAALIPGRAGDLCAVDTRAAGAAKVSWELSVTPAEANQDMVLKWENISAAPKRYHLTLVDQATGRSQFMRTTSSYRFNSGDGSPRRFAVIADSSPSTRLMIANLAVGATRGSSISVTYNLTTDAQVSAEITGPTGKRLRQLEAGRVTRFGINTLTWDRRDAEGRAVPAGVYFLALSAATEEGEMVKSVRPILVAR